MLAAIIAANGSSSRFAGNKLNEQILDKTVLRHTFDAFFSIVDEIIIVSDDKNLQKEFPNAKIVSGGKTRSLSVANGLKSLSKECKFVAIHDAARPFVTKDTLKKLFESAIKQENAIPVLPAVDTSYLLEIEENSPSKLQSLEQGVEFSSFELKNVDRSKLFRVQTPQVFAVDKILEAYEKIDLLNSNFTDDSQIYLNQYQKLNFVLGQPSNFKITYKNDLPDFKIGVGFDVHRLVDGDGVVLGGVKIPFSKKLLGHSDADVLTHAIMDALLSASGNKDIGTQFPDNDEKYRGANSIELLKKVVQMVENCNFEIVNISAVIITEQPKMSPYLDEIAKNLSNTLNISQSSVNLTATTTENLGTTANAQAIASNATALVRKI